MPITKTNHLNDRNFLIRASHDMAMDLLTLFEWCQFSDSKSRPFFAAGHATTRAPGLQKFCPNT